MGKGALLHFCERSESEFDACIARTFGSTIGCLWDRQLH